MWGTVYSLARVLMPLLFIIEGIGKFAHVADVAARLEKTGLTVPAQFDALGVPRFALLVYLAAAIEVVCGLMVMLGYKTRFAALVLALYAAGTIFVWHSFWTMEGLARAGNITQALKNLSIIAGLLIIASLGAGRYSLDGRRSRR
jgi:putative oxidoreductase